MEITAVISGAKSLRTDQLSAFIFDGRIVHDTYMRHPLSLIKEKISSLRTSSRHFVRSISKTPVLKYTEEVSRRILLILSRIPYNSSSGHKFFNPMSTPSSNSCYSKNSCIHLLWYIQHFINKTAIKICCTCNMPLNYGSPEKEEGNSFYTELLPVL